MQVRTIFEEGWSEIDHKVRYPNFSEEQTTKYFLDIFNRLAGSADEMGSFVKALDVELKNRAALLTIANDESQRLKSENEESMASIDRLIGELETSKGKINASSNLIKDLKHEVARLKSTSNVQSSFGITASKNKYITESARMAALAASHQLGLGFPQSVLGGLTTSHGVASRLGLGSVDLTELRGLSVARDSMNTESLIPVVTEKSKEDK